jgi:hypothetical protein
MYRRIYLILTNVSSPVLVRFMQMLLMVASSCGVAF